MVCGMDKEIYPFVIRSIRAVDSRQIFQLMDSKNNDVRREKVDSGHFVICDPEKEYAENLTKFICEKEKTDFQFQIFYDLESLIIFSNEIPIDILLIAEECIREETLGIPAKKTFILTKKENYRKEEDKRSIYRYQPAEKIVKLIFCDSKEDISTKETTSQIRKRQHSEKQSVRKGLIGIYSPIHRIGKTKFAIQLGIKTAKYVPTLYLNLEEYPASELYFPDQKEKNLGDLLYYAGQNKDNLGLRISTIAGQIDELDYIMPIPIMRDLREVKEKDWINLFDQILKKCIYETVILDLGDSIDGLYPILKNCSAVYTHYVDDPVSKEKIMSYEQNIRQMGMEEILEHTIRKRITRKNRNSLTEEKKA